MFAQSKNIYDISIVEKFEAIIFDCDGVLVNSEEILQGVELALLGEHGLDYDLEEYSRRFLGVSNKTFFAELNKDSMNKLGIPLPEDFIDRIGTAARATFESDLIAFDGVHELVQKWQGALAVASSSSAENLALKLRITRLSSIFDPHVYSADEVAAGKPDPAIYLHAAQQLSISPKHCVAIEDSINGIVSARAAGMGAIGFTEGRHCLPHHGDLLLRAGADAIASSMQELAELLT